MRPNLFATKPLDPVADEAALAAVPKRARTNEQPCYVIGTNGIYFWKHLSTKVALATRVVVPDDLAADADYIADASTVPGRWELTAPEGRVSTLADLAAYVPAESIIGTEVITERPPARWSLYTAIYQITDPRRQVFAYTDPTDLSLSPGDNGIWIRDVITGAPGAASVSEWWIDPTNPLADDDNPNPADDFTLATMSELLCRLGKQPIDGNDAVLIANNGSGIVYVHVQSTMPSPGTIDLNFINDGAIAFIGPRNVVATATISASTPWNDTTGVVGSYTLTGAPNLTGHVGHFVRVSSGPRLGWKAPIAKALSASSFRGSFADQAANGASVEPVVGDTVELYTVPTLTGDLRISSGVPGTNGGTIYFEAVELGVTGQSHSVVVASGQASFTACALHGLDFYTGCDEGLLNACYVVECRSYGFVEAAGCTFATVGGTNLSARGRGVIRISARCLIQGGGISAGHTLEGPGDIRCNAPVASCDYIGSAAQVFPASSIVLDEVLTARDAAGAPQGVLVNSGGQFFYASGKAPVIVGTTPTNDYRIGGTLKAKAAVPYFETANAAVVAVNQ